MCIVEAAAMTVFIDERRQKLRQAIFAAINILSDEFGRTPIKLIELIDMDMIPKDSEIYYSDDGSAGNTTVAELNSKTLTDEGKEVFKDVINQDVRYVTRLSNGQWLIELVDSLNIGEERAIDELRNFTMFLAGFCGESDYERWFNDEVED
jgi:hypothetical protein